ncbi:penicillin-binding protein [Arsenicibacter rosenii]|nr:penicillin-binding protein [Arsenicibacter rosenii]
MSEKPSNIKQEFLLRATLAFIAIALFAVAVVVRLVYVQFFEVYEGKRWIERLEGVKIRRDTLRAMRGNIYAADGRSLLATSLPSYDVGLDPTVADSLFFARKKDSLGTVLHNVFRDRTKEEYIRLAEDAREEGLQYVSLPRRVSFSEREYMRKWPFFRKRDRIVTHPDKKNLKRTKIYRGGGGVFRAYYERYHPFGTMAERTLGMLNPENGKGLRGLEESYQSELAGKNAVGLIEVLSGGVKKPVEDGPDMRPEPGMDLYTTIDVNYQDIAESSLRKYMEKFQADKGCVLIMEVATGEIKAIANLTRSGDRYFENFNHALAGRTDPGSTFKLATMIALLEEKAITPKTLVPTGNGRTTYRGVEIKDSGHKGYGTITAQQVFEKSSNVGIHLMMKNYFYSRPDLYCQYLRKFKLTQPTGIHMKGEAKPFIRNPDMKGWSRTSLTFMSYGYEMLITPLQMATFYNAVANDGKWVRPMLVKQVRLADEVIIDNKPYVAPEPICSERTVKLVKNMLEGVVLHGTASKIGTKFYRIAGKTGTAQKKMGQSGSYYSSFIGYFPANRPKYTVLAAIDNPRFSNNDSLYGGKVAAPVFKEVADRIHAFDIHMHPPLVKRATKHLPDLKAGLAEDLHTIGTELALAGEPDTDGWVQKTKSGGWKSQSSNQKRVPDVRGLTLRDALYLLENRGIRVSITGQGRVKEQSIEPGTAIKGPQAIALVLE